MSTLALTFDVRQFLTHHLADVFSTMVSMKATPAPEGMVPHFEERVTGSVGFGGEAVSGAVYLHLSADLALRVTSAMLGLPPEEIGGEGEVNDVVGEMTNMLAGGLKSTLCDLGATCAVSTPAIIRGRAYEIEAMPDVRRESMVFDCETECVSVEVHIKFN
jgi:CheY-specific phosphatase CheX